MTRVILPLMAFCAAFAVILPWPFMLYLSTTQSHLWTALFTGLSILGAAFLLSWAVEAIEGDVPPVAALSVLALIGLLPEYAVDATFAWDAATRPEEGEYVLANMTGGNRIMIGFGWPMVVLLAAARFRRAQVELPRSASIPFVALLAASLYGVVPWALGRLSLLDVAVMLLLYTATIVLLVRAPLEAAHEAPAVGPAALLERLPSYLRWGMVTGLLGIAAGSIFVAADAFADSLVLIGLESGVDEYLLVQWIAPIASEAPELLIAALLVFSGHAAKGLVLLVSAKVNQWMLLAGTMPLLTSLAAGEPRSLPFSERQATELLLTLSFSLFGLVLLAERRLAVGSALLLLVAYLSQLIMTGVGARWAFAITFMGLAIGIFTLRAATRRALWLRCAEAFGVRTGTRGSSA